jgi:hypothetical protein
MPADSPARADIARRSVSPLVLIQIVNELGIGFGSAARGLSDELAARAIMKSLASTTPC